MCSPETLAAGRGALARVTEGLYLLARFRPDIGQGPPAGRRWERWIADDLLPRGAEVSQGPGTLRLFGTAGASGLRHELDGATRSRWGALLTEAKAYEAHGPTKSDVCLFDRKSFDLILARHQIGDVGPHWRLMASASPADDAVRRYCYLHAIVLVDPAMLPLPYLLRAAARPAADLIADPVLWDELVRLAERAVQPLEGRYRPVGEDLVFSSRWWPARDLEDLLFVQARLTEQIIAAIDVERPTFFAERAGAVLSSLGTTAPAPLTRSAAG